MGFTTVLVFGALWAVPLASGAANGPANPASTPAQSHPSTTPVPNHALHGVVKSVDATTLVVTRAGKSPGEMTFVLSPATHRDGAISVGATVQVRFRMEGDTRVATAVLATAPKRRAAPT